MSLPDGQAAAAAHEAHNIAPAQQQIAQGQPVLPEGGALDPHGAQQPVISIPVQQSVAPEAPDHEQATSAQLAGPSTGSLYISAIVNELCGLANLTRPAANVSSSPGNGAPTTSMQLPPSSNPGYATLLAVDHSVADTPDTATLQASGSELPSGNASGIKVLAAQDGLSLAPPILDAQPSGYIDMQTDQQAEASAGGPVESPWRQKRKAECLTQTDATAQTQPDGDVHLNERSSKPAISNVAAQAATPQFQTPRSVVQPQREVQQHSNVFPPSGRYGIESPLPGIQTSSVAAPAPYKMLSPPSTPPAADAAIPGLPPLVISTPEQVSAFATSEAHMTEQTYTFAVQLPNGEIPSTEGGSAGQPPAGEGTQFLDLQCREGSDFLHFWQAENPNTPLEESKDGPHASIMDTSGPITGYATRSRLAAAAARKNAAQPAIGAGDHAPPLCVAVPWLTEQVNCMSEKSQGVPLPAAADAGGLVGRSVAFVLLSEVDVKGDVVRIGLHSGRCEALLSFRMHSFYCQKDRAGIPGQYLSLKVYTETS